ncbi:hypothetical protein LSH36_35g08030 [Paralvinella palmiformis]|uniref:EF-hand domain-containing protein n=1 Tax=Paralvinella palmiformis TaxID=53620 RepID=A0AAD9K8U2_9ANNE|nr:hypothetical protein LSH36_35g08030 [Paralvinella palmiformis]
MGNNNGSELPDDTVAELRRNTGFTSGEIHQMYRDFKVDFPEGVITRDRFAGMYRKLFPDGCSDTFAGYVFSAYDKDGNGVIDFDEFVATLAVAANGTDEEKLQWAFQLYDLDGDGEVTRDETKEMIMAIHRMKGNKNARNDAEIITAKIFHSLDKNRDDSLSQAEFVAAVHRSPDIGNLFRGAI